jgi:nucleoid DNA-binding protein
MNNSEVIKHLSQRLGQSQHEIRMLLKSSTQIIKKILDEDISFTIPKLGTFGTHLRQKREAYNPHHKKFVILPPKRVVFFHPSSVLKDHVKGQRGDDEG